MSGTLMPMDTAKTCSVLEEVVTNSVPLAPQVAVDVAASPSSCGNASSQKNHDGDAQACTLAATKLSTATEGSAHLSLGIVENVSQPTPQTDLSSTSSFMPNLSPTIHGCTLCTKTFSRHSNLVRHVRQKHPGHVVPRPSTGSSGASAASKLGCIMAGGEADFMQPQLNNLSAQEECVASDEVTTTLAPPPLIGSDAEVDCTMVATTAPTAPSSCMVCGEVFCEPTTFDEHIAHHVTVLANSGNLVDVQHMLSAVGVPAQCRPLTPSPLPAQAPASAYLSTLAMAACPNAMATAAMTPMTDASDTGSVACVEGLKDVAVSSVVAAAAAALENGAAAIGVETAQSCELGTATADQLASERVSCGGHSTPSVERASERFSPRRVHRCGTSGLSSPPIPVGNGTAERKFQCTTCGKCFSQRTILERHRATHSSAKLFKCSVCQKGFKDRHDCRRHERIHSGERPFQCTVCNKTFSQAANLEKHRRIHSDDKPHTCDVCGKSFIERGKLQRHLRTHSGEQPYECLVCHRFFSQKHHLQVHMRIHTGEKPHACDLCGKLFRDRKDLVRHRRLHTGEKPYTCTECNMSFRLRALLTKHQRVMHTELVMTSMVTDGFVVPLAPNPVTPAGPVLTATAANDGSDACTMAAAISSGTDSDSVSSTSASSSSVCSSATVHDSPRGTSLTNSNINSCADQDSN